MLNGSLQFRVIDSLSILLIIWFLFNHFLFILLLQDKRQRLQHFLKRSVIVYNVLYPGI